MHSARFLLTAAALLGTLVHAQTYRLTDLGDLGGPFSHTVAGGMNEAGEVVGTSNVSLTADHSFIWLPSPAHGLGAGINDLSLAIGETSTEGNAAINDAGQVTGGEYRWQIQPFSKTSLGTLPSGSVVGGRAINPGGSVAGFGNGSLGSPVAFRWDPIGGLVQIDGLLGPDQFATGLAINDVDAGQVAGYSRTNVDKAFLWIDPGTPDTRYPFLPSGIMDLGTIEGPFIGSAHGAGINDSTVIVGDSSTGTGVSHAAMWTPDPVSPVFFLATDLGALVGGTGFSQASDINNNGDVVGSSSAPGGTVAVAWLGGGPITDLHTLVDSSGAGWTLIEAIAINDAGWIVGNGTNPQGESHAFLLRPKGCVVDFNLDGALDSLDFFAFLDLFAAGDDDADLNGDLDLDSTDFFLFLDLFVVGC
ncbi:MAG: hypothetical protein H6811_10575 [Phycisphaeraceae bacterium]|nr:hypothetical protein [Phycisphaeraceae bacterium]